MPNAPPLNELLPDELPPVDSGEPGIENCFPNYSGSAPVAGDMSASVAQELKQQGAIEAARNPQSSVTADDAQREMVEQSKNAGIPAFTFDPDASAQEKRAQAQAVSPLNYLGWTCTN